MARLVFDGVDTRELREYVLRAVASAPSPTGFRFMLPHDEAMGRWASRVELSVDPDSFTLDFFRVDSARRIAILVSRVTLSALAASSLAEVLDRGLGQYAASLVESGTKPLAFEEEGGDNDADGSELPDG